MQMFSKPQQYSLIACSFFVVFTLTLAFLSIPVSALGVHFLDIGQGDAIFIETPHKRQVLIDGGPVGSPLLTRLNTRLPFYDRTLDFVIATHMDADHIGGLIQVLERYKVGAMLVATTNAPSSLSQQLFHVAQTHQVPLVIVRRGDRFILDDDVRLDIVAPWDELVEHASENNAAIVARLSYKNDSFLLTADIERKTEYALTRFKNDIDVDVLKIAHHGSNSSSVKQFLETTSPHVAIIQVGKNRYGHPHPLTLQRLREAGIPILRNDQNGVISIYSYGDSI